MQLEGAKEEQVLLRSVQWHAYKPQVLHVDFQRVDANQALRTKVPLHFPRDDRTGNHLPAEGSAPVHRSRPDQHPGWRFDPPGRHQAAHGRDVRPPRR
ncbi:hypothetical protein G6F60_014992 [Rhizopus arrhizus]|nr:hypothetical protein G6F60_014992 [Rhizopus arrhizus]